MSYRDQKEVEKAAFYIQQAEVLCLQTKNWDLLARVYNLAGVIEYTKDNFDSALWFYQKALAVSEQHTTSNPDFLPISRMNFVLHCRLYWHRLRKR